MEIYKLKFTALQNGIFRLLCMRAGEQLNKREIALALGVSPTAVAKALPLMQKEGLVNFEKVRNMNLSRVELNRDNGLAVSLKRTENLKMIYESGLSGFLEESFPGTAIILFGSYSKGEDTISSDIDMAVIGTKDKGVDLEKFEKILERKISLHLFLSLKDTSKEFRENVFNGIVLAGGIEA